MKDRYGYFDGIEKYKKGKILTFDKLLKMKDCDIVYVTWKEYGEHEFRIDWASRIEFLDNNTIMLTDASSDFELKYENINDECYSDKSGQGDFYLYEAIKT